MVGHFGLRLSTRCWEPVLPNLIKKLRLDKSQAGTFFMIISVGLLIATVPSGLTMDVLGTKLIICLGLCLVAAAFSKYRKIKIWCSV